MIDVVRQEEIAVLHLAHGKANALDTELCVGLTESLEGLAASTWPAAVVLTGRGSIFSAGVDLVRLTREGRPYVERFFPALRQVLETLFFFPKPLVVAVNGHAIAGGALFACAGDLALAARGSARIGVPELRVGVAFPGIALEIVRFACPGSFQELVYRGRTYDPEAAVSLGFVDEVVAPEALLPTALERANELAALPLALFALTKHQLRAPVRARVEAHRTTTEAGVRDHWLSPETHRAIDAYVSSTFKRGS